MKENPIPGLIDRAIAKYGEQNAQGIRNLVIRSLSEIGKENHDLSEADLARIETDIDNAMNFPPKNNRER
ncbi:MAG: hypothetical protein ACTHMM_17755 [Agriterribacter sp.]